jgi:hypothetical protein
LSYPDGANASLDRVTCGAIVQTSETIYPVLFFEIPPFGFSFGEGKSERRNLEKVAKSNHATHDEEVAPQVTRSNEALAPSG